MRPILIIASGAALLLHASQAHAESPTVAVADFDYVDSSGEPSDQQAAHAQRLNALKAEIIASLTHSGDFAGVALNCAKPPCSAGNLDQDDISKSARAQNAQFVVFGGVHKISTLIQWGQVEVMNTATGKAAASRTVTFRGDSDDAWRHAADYVGELVVAAIKK
jgi:TolB-like protein